MRLATSLHAPKDIISYLSTFEDGTLVSLYSDEFAALTVFRSLQDLEKQHVMNLVLCSTPIPNSSVEKWSLSSAHSHHKAAIHKLSELKIIESVEDGEKLQLNANFQNSLKMVIFLGAPSVDNNDNKILHPSSDKIEKHAKSRWERILTILVGAGDDKLIGDSLRNQVITTLLIRVGLIRRKDGAQGKIVECNRRVSV